jgi:hypothetical protein
VVVAVVMAVVLMLSELDLEDLAVEEMVVIVVLLGHLVQLILVAEVEVLEIMIHKVEMAVLE